MITPAGQAFNSPLYTTPEDIFTGAVDGLWYDPSNLSSLFQDAAGTIPVTADGDPVGLMRDLSGNGFHATQTSAGNRPIYKTDGQLHWIECASASSHFMTHNANAPGTGEFLVVYALDSASTGITPFLAFGSGISTTYTGISFRRGSGNAIQINGADATGAGALIGIGASSGKQVVSATRTTVFQQGFQLSLSSSNLGTLNLTNANKRLFCYYTFANQSFMNGKFFGGVYVRGATTPQQRQIAQEYLARKSNLVAVNSASYWSVVKPIIQRVNF
jgi:hypothetical protein